MMLLTEAVSQQSVRLQPSYRRQIFKLKGMAEDIPKHKNTFQILKSQPSLDIKSPISQL